MARYRLVTFDITNTILQFRVGIGTQYLSAMKEFGVNADPSDVATNFKKFFKQQCINHPNFGCHSRMTANQWWSEIVYNTVRSSSSTSVDDNTLFKISHRLYSMYASNEAWTLTRNTESILQKLQNSGVCLGVISNFDDRLLPILQQHRIDHYFKFILASYENGCAKPHPQIFKLAEAKSNLKNLQKCEVVHVGDDVHLDYNAARSFGWNALLFVGDNPLDDETKPIYEKNAAFRSFSEILQHVFQ